MSRKTRTDSTDSKVTARKNADSVIEPPEGVTLDNEQEEILWRQFTRSRAIEDWREIDLVMVVKAVKIETNIREHQSILDKTGPIIQNKRGTAVPNPLFDVIDRLTRQQLAIIRSMSLMTTGDARTTANRQAAEESHRNSAIESDPKLALFARRNK